MQATTIRERPSQMRGGESRLRPPRAGVRGAGSARLVVVSNRVSLPGEWTTRAGGLAVAMRDALRRSGGLWFGWNGEVVEDPPADPTVLNRRHTRFATLALSPAEYHDYYSGYANGTLWPLLHYRIGLIDYQKQSLAGYLAVNDRLARALKPLLRPDDDVWVHDYHLIPFAQALRRQGVANRLGFFLHTPLPVPEVLMVLPGHEKLIEALAAFDLLGFQTDKDAAALRHYIIDEARGSETQDGSLLAFGRRFRAEAFPIGIDTLGFAAEAAAAVESAEAQRLRDSLAGRSLIIGVDRLDYSKGLVKRMHAVDALLTERPEHRGAMTYLQIAPLSRAELSDYRSMRRELEAAAARVNGRHAEFDWAPVRYLNKSFSRATLSGFYRIAKVGLVTPLRDGMNLVAKEYVAAQDPDDPGVLILSRFAGAARELTAALIVNPFDHDQMTQALHRALTMTLEERQRRWREMMAVLRENSVDHWVERFLGALRAVPRDA
jgi:trehalose 6-phosphate synthase